ncbi:MAG: LamG-like jellyroll fold domain-containing protein [Oculatellaceae cyanobacterium bins.114]|nr:LamG-like jellyroll fold domain-containing protein [Oculatellaceae cyanobacterium bins.114]
MMSIDLQVATREVFERFRETYPELGSITAIAAQSEDSFVNAHIDKFEGGSREARQVYRLAVNLKQKADFLWLNIQDVFAAHLQQTLFNNLPTDLPDTFISHQAEIPAYKRLFGGFDVIEQEHCRSIFGPAAYFVDLLRFIEANITQKLSSIPAACQLNWRRPDLSRIRLDCNNAHELIPYVELVNELLETFVKTIETADQDAYEILKKEVFPMHLPYHLPLDEIRSYLKQLKTSLYQIYRIFERSPQTGSNTTSPNTGFQERMTGEALELSPEEFSLLVSELAAPLQVYGDVPLTGREGLENIDVFLEQTELTRKELNQLLFQDLDRHEINAGLSRLFFINNVNDGLGYLTIAVADSNAAITAVNAVASTAETNDYDKLLNLSLAKLDRIYRFLKLARKLNWSFADLDWALRSLHTPYIPETALLFDGVNDYVECRDVHNLDLSEFTLEAWINPTEPGRNVIISKGNEAEHQLHFMVWVDSANRLAFYGKLSTPGDIEIKSLSTIPVGVFTHVAVVVDEYYGTICLFINGDLVNIDVDINEPPDTEASSPIEQKDVQVARLGNRKIVSVGDDLYIGRDLYDEHFTGIIKEVRIWSNSRSQLEIQEYRYRRLTGQEQRLVAYWALTETPSNTLLDLTPNENHGVMGGAQFSTQPKWVQRDLVLDALSAGQGLRLNGVDDYLAAKGVNYGDLKEVTLEVWIKLEARSEKNTILFKGNKATGQSQFAVWINADGKLVFQSDSLAKPYTSEDSIPLGELTHIALALDQEGTSRKQILKIYFNGILDVQIYVDPADPDILPVTAQEGDRANSYLLVGRSVEGAYFNGVIRELRIWNQARTKDQIALYLYRPISAGEAGLIGYWRLDEIDISPDSIAPDLVTGVRHPLMLGGIAPDHAPDRITLSDRLLPPLPIAVSGTVLQFDGDNDVIVIHEAKRADQHNSKRWGLGQYDRFTLEFWFNAQEQALSDRQQVLFSQGDAEAGLSVYLLQHRLHVLVWTNNFEGNALQQSLFKSEPITYHQWYHLAIAQDEFPTPNGPDARPLPLEPIELRVYLNGNLLPTPSGTQTALGFRLSPVGVAYLGGLGERGITKFEDAYSAIEVEHLYFFSGQITDLRLWKIAKTAAQIESDRHVAPTTSPDLVAYFPTTETQGNEIKDCTENLANVDVGTLQSRNIAFVTNGSGIELENTFSHYVTPTVLTWSNYIYTGRIYIDSEAAAIGVTFLSQYPNHEARFYRLQRHAQRPQFHLVAHTYGFQPLTLVKEVEVIPQPNTWYRFRVRVEDINNQTEIKVQIWEDELDNIEPPEDAFQLQAIDTSSYRLTQGTVGVWAFGDGKKRFDRLKVERIAPIGLLGETLLTDSNFEPYDPPTDPSGWNHTSDRIDFQQNALLFKSVTLDGNQVLRTDQTLENMQSFYDLPEALTWSNYVYTGKIRFTATDSGAGVSVLSRYPDGKDQCYRLQRDRLKSKFYLDARPYGIQPITGTVESGVESRPEVWYRFRIEVRNTETTTSIKARVWEAGTNEPTTFQMDVTDTSPIRIQSGTVGVWASDSGSKYFDELQVVFLPNILLEENFAQYSLNQDPDFWVDTSTRINFDEVTPLFKAVADPTDAGNIVLGFTETGDRELNSAYSHYAKPTENPTVLTWTNYIYTGRFYVADLTGSIGVTVLSQFPNRQERCYRLGYDGNFSTTFQVVSVIPGDIASLSGKSDSGVVAQANTWFRFRIEVESNDTANQTRIRARIWQHGTPEPQVFQIDAFEAGDQRLKAGTVGIWVADLGLKLFDDLRVQRRILYSTNFGTTPVGQLPPDWQITKGNRAFKVVEVAGNRVLSTEQGQSNEIHAHLRSPETLTWSHYTYTGRFYIDSPSEIEAGKSIAKGGGIGVSFFSRYTATETNSLNRNRYYRMRVGAATGERTFGLRADPGGVTSDTNQRDTNIRVEVKTWYRFQVEVYNTATRTEMQAKVWKESDPMPEAFQMEGYDDSTPNLAQKLPGRVTSGTIGVWAEGEGIKYFDDLQVSEGMILFEEFAPLSLNQHPNNWVDTSIRHSFVPEPGLFKTIEVDGKTVFGTTSEKYSAHSHYTLPGEVLNWSNYTYMGKLRLTDANGGIGVTVLSRYPEDRDTYYRLSYGRTTQFNTFHLVAYPYTPVRLMGDTDSGITPALNVWYRFRMTVQDAGDRTTIKAKIWQDGHDEPVEYSIDAYDNSGNPGGNGTARLTSGTVGVWGAGQGSKFFDELAVFRHITVLEDFGNDASDTNPPQWRNVSARSLFATDLTLFATADVSDNTLHWTAVDNYPLLLRPLNQQALRFDGRGEYVAGALQQPLELTQFTVAAWIQLTGSPNPLVEQENPIVGLGGLTLAGQAVKLWFGITVGTEGQQHFKLSVSQVQDQTRLIDQTHPIPLGEFVYVAVQVDGDRVTFYLAGEQDFANEANVRKLQTPLALRVNRIEIGRDLGTRYFAGQIKELRLWNVARPLDGAIADRYQRPVVSRELVGYWAFNETQGTETRDASMSGNTLWLGDSVGARQPDLVDLTEADRGFWRSQRQVLGFNGTDQRVTLSDQGSGSARLRRTIEVWFRVEDKGIGDRKQVIYHEGDDQRGLNIYLFDGCLYFGGYNVSPIESDWQGTWIKTDRIQSGKWHHVALVLDGRAEVRPASFRAFLDGRSIDVSPGSQLWGDRPPSSMGGVSSKVRFHDGVSLDRPGHFFRGQILELRVWNTVRTATQIATYRMAELQGDEPFLALWWVFDGLTSTPNGVEILDMSGNRHTAIVESGQIQPIILPQRATLPETDLTAPVLDGLATIKQLQDQSNLSIDRLVALWYRIKHMGREDKTTLFDQVFNPKGIAGDARRNSEAARWEAYPIVRWGRLGQENLNRDRQIRTRLMGALQTSDADLNTIVESLSGLDPIIDLDSAYLNQLYRLARLSRLLGLGVNDLLRLMDWMQLQSVNSLSDVVQLVERADWLKLTGITVADLEFFASPVGGDRLLGITEATIRDVADSLIRQSRDFLVNGDSFVSNEISQAQAIALFAALTTSGFLSPTDFVDGKRAVTEQYQGLNDLSNLNLSDLELQEQLRPHWVQVDALLTRLRDEHKNALLVELATLFDTQPDVMQVVFAEYESLMQPIQFLTEMQTLQTPGSILSNNLIVYLNTLTKVLTLATRFGLTAAELAVLFDHPDYFSVNSVLQPAIADLNSLYQFKTFKTLYSDTQGNLVQLLQTTTALDATQAIVTLTGWDEEQLRRLQVYFGSTRLYNRLADLAQLQPSIDLAQSLQVDVDLLIQLVLPQQTFQGFQQLAAALLKVLQAQYSTEDWQTVYKPIRNQISVRRRDALLGLALRKLAQKTGDRRDADLLYEYFLVDPQVGSEVETSRILQATASLQLYVQRCLMNLEKGVDPSKVPLKEWEWMKNYRVWEANRKVFLYPENYIEPELRDTKTPLFEELEQELLQSDINQRSVERAYTNYLDKFAELANLRIVGSYLRKLSDTEKILYLIGRTDTQPRIYYYRELHLVDEQPSRWLPWYKIDLTINSDYVTPVYAFDRLFLFWAEITKTTESFDVDGTQQSRDVYEPTVKYSYYNFSEAWAQPQTYLQLGRKLDQATIQLQQWQRVNVQRGIVPRSPDSLGNNSGDDNTAQPVNVLKVARKNNQANFALERSVYFDSSDSTWSIWAKLIDQGVVSSSLQSTTLELFTYTNGQLAIAVLAQQAVISLPTASLTQKAIEKPLLDKLNPVFLQARRLLKASEAAIAFIETRPSLERSFNELNSLDQATTLLREANQQFSQTLNELQVELGTTRTEVLRRIETEITSLATGIATMAQQVRLLVTVSSEEIDITRQIVWVGEQTNRQVVKILQNVEDQPTKAQFVWGTPSLTLQVILGGRLVLESPMEFGKWTHIALTFQPQSDRSTLWLCTTKLGELSTTQACEVFLDRLPTTGLLTVGIPNKPDLSSSELVTAQLSEFQLWSYARDQATIVDEMSQRKDGNELGLILHLPLDTDGGNANLVIEPSNAGGNGLFLRRSRFSLPYQINVDQERMLVFYGDTLGTLRNNLDDQSFGLTLERRNTQPHYDVTITQSNLHIVTTAGLSMNDFAAGGDTQSRTADVTLAGTTYNLRNYNPEYLRSIVITYDRLTQSGQLVPPVLTTLVNAINAYLNETISSNNNLLQNLPAFESTVFDVNNQPGWYIVNTKNEQFLLMAEQPAKTVEERLKFEYGKTQTRSAPQPITVYFDADLSLQVPDQATPPGFKFKLERISTYAIHKLSQNLFKGGLDALVSRQSQLTQEWNFGDYQHNPERVTPPSTYQGTTPETIDFNGAYGVYYWEIFFHIPFLIANRLNANQNFADAQRWYHYIFDPTARETASPGQHPGDRYWQFVPFRNRQSTSLAELLTNSTALAEYRNDPFDPHAIARLRLVAYQKAIVMKYIDNLLDWGDALFTRDTRESINEATMLYVLGYNLLGQRPNVKTVKELREVGTYADFLKEHEALEQANTDLIQQNNLDFEFWSGDERTLLKTNGANPHRQLITSFLVPENETFIGYWDRVEDRLYKIRHSLNIEGVFRQLALFDPPIDPMALVRAVAGGRDLGSVLNDVNAPVPHYRYAYLLEKAKEMVSFVTELGGSLLEVIEKREAAQLEVMLNTHEQSILDLTTQVKRWELDGAQKQLDQLQINKQRTEDKKEYLTKLINNDLSTEEEASLTLKGLAQGSRTVASVLKFLASNFYAIPDVIAGAAGVASPVALTKAGGEGVGNVLQGISDGTEMVADVLDTAADMTEKIGEYKRRKGEWEQEKKVAESELREIDVQIAVAQIELQKTQRELLLHQKAITQSQEIATFYRSKFSNQTLHNWMIGRLSALYFQAYKLAYDLAKSAEKALQFELPTTDTFISFGHWDSLKKGLLAGESLMLELNRMSKFHLDRDSRFLEMEKTISLKVSPNLSGELQTLSNKLSDLKSSGVCEFNLSERLFDEDYPGHYCRLLKTISISIQVNFEGMSPDERRELELRSVNATVIQRSNKTLLQPDIKGVEYLLGNHDEQPNASILRVDWRTNQQIAISRAEENSGTFGNFDLNILFDDRYFPFEGTGAVSSWRLELPQETPNRFPLDKIDDVVIRLRYTAKTDSGKFKQDVIKRLKSSAE